MAQDVASIVVVDDSAEVLLLLRTRLRLSGRLRVVGEGADGADAVRLAEQHQPLLLLLDVSMPAMDGLEALPRIRSVSPSTRVVLYTGFEAEGLAEKALAMGASAFVEKSTSVDALIDRLLALVEAAPGENPVEASATVRTQEQVLDEHLERFRKGFEDAAIGMATMTLSGDIVRANRALATLLQRSPEDLVGVSYGGLTGAQQPRLAAALDDIVHRSVDLVQIEHGVAETADDRRVRATLAPVRDSRGQALYVFLQAQDVTAERSALERLRQSEQRFRLLVDAVEDYAIFMLSADGVIESWNAGAQRSTGYTADEIIGQHFRVFYPPEQREARHPEHELELALRDGHYEEEGWRVRKDGSRYWSNVVITAVFDESGRHVGFAKVTRDITGRRRTQEALRQSEERFRLLVDAVEDYAIFMLDPTGHIVSWNAGAQRIKGYTAEEVLGRHFRIFYPPEQQEIRHPEHELELAMRDGRYGETGWRVRKDGSLFWADVLITAVFSAEGRHLGFTKVTRDMTERRRLEEEREHAVQALADANTELKALNERLRQAADDQGQFLAVTAHELRTPIGVLAGSADALTRYGDALTDEERRDLLSGMTSSTNRLRRLLDDLLTASRLQASALQMKTEPLQVVDVVEDAVSAIRRTRPEVEIGFEPIDVTVVADRDRLAQALDNLLGNALRHGAPPVRVSVAASPTTVEIRVVDSGAGVDEAIRHRLFGRFATGRRKGGTGLGLFIVREIARANGGEAFYEPPSADVPSGAFVIALPRTDTAA